MAPGPATRQAGIPVWRHIGATAAPQAATAQQVPVLVVGAGPVGLAMALDLGRRGHPVVVVSRLPFVAGGSKAICFSKRSLDIFHRLGVGSELLQQGVTWNLGKVFWGDRSEPIYQFDMLPVKDQQYPGFINLQQYYVEDALLRALQELPHVDLRLGQDVVALRQRPDGVEVEVDAAGQRYRLHADWLVACDGSRSTVRQLMARPVEGIEVEVEF
mgnify:CR=1 FL=1